MAHDLHTKERDLLASLTQLESEASSHSVELQILNSKILSIKADLNGIRHELLDEFLAEHLTSRLIAYEIKVLPEEGTLLNITPIVGGELEYDKLKSQINWHDMSNIPLFHILSYLEQGIPWSDGNTYQYNIE